MRALNDSEHLSEHGCELYTHNRLIEGVTIDKRSLDRAADLSYFPLFQNLPFLPSPLPLIDSFMLMPFDFHSLLGYNQRQYPNPP